ncbi:hypothetical protein [Streptomyces sp. NPDC056660]|uniref:hypothetical protein n=1 Tax=Streptomyces sp. NPDC056660 TaxID=3345897 RepID=UPI0036743201
MVQEWKAAAEPPACAKQTSRAWAPGAQLGGLLVGAYGTWAAFVAAVAALLAGAAVAFAVRHRFTAPAGTPGSTHVDPADPDLCNA